MPVTAVNEHEDQCVYSMHTRVVSNASFVQAAVLAIMLLRALKRIVGFGFRLELFIRKISVNNA
jgi:hypothetical protein